MDTYGDIISSFKVQKTLNPKIWDNVDDDPKLNKEIRDRLLEIAYEFIDFLGVDILITDIVMTGSLANYNWSKYSDVDLHIVANFNQFPSNQLELYKEFFTLKKIIFNENDRKKTGWWQVTIVAVNYIFFIRLYNFQVL